MSKFKPSVVYIVCSMFPCSVFVSSSVSQMSRSATASIERMGWDAALCDSFYREWDVSLCDRQYNADRMPILILQRGQKDDAAISFSDGSELTYVSFFRSRM